MPADPVRRPLQLAAGGWTFSGLEWPGSGPAVLCLHGFPQRSTSWSAVADRLAALGRRVVAVDQRGYSPGARPTSVGEYALDRLVADAAAVAGAVGAPVHLVGHDWGGVVGWQLAARRPDLVRSFTAVSTPNPTALAEVLATDAGERERFGYIRGLREVGTAEAALLGNGGAGLAALYGGRIAPRRVAEDVAFFAGPGVLTAALAWYRAMERTDSVGVPDVRVPTAYVWGSADPAFGRPAAERSGAHVRAPYRFVALEGVGHWVPDEAPDTLADVIAATIETAEGGPAVPPVPPGPAADD